MTPGLQTLADDLTPQSDTRRVLDFLALQHLDQAPNQKQTRLAMEGWADALATGSGGQRDIALTDPGSITTFQAVFERMDRDQAARFLDELFGQIVPHVANQRAWLRDIARGQTDAGNRVDSSPLLQAVAQTLEQLPTDELDTIATTFLRKLTWRDDGQHTITARGTVEAEVGGRSKPIRF